MLACFTSKAQKNIIPIELITQKEYTGWLSKQHASLKQWLTTSGFKAEGGKISLVPDASGKVVQVICCLNDANHFWAVGGLPFSLPEGTYQFKSKKKLPSRFYVAWGLGAYQFTLYKKSTRQPATLFVSATELKSVEKNVESLYWVRDLINLPTESLGPTELSKEAQTFSKKFGLTFKQIVGDELLKKNFPCIHLVGRASDDSPRLLDLRWGKEKHPKLTLVGKGICFDTGGLDLKPAALMLLMKKDMAGAAHVLGLARMIVEAKLPVRLRVLLPVAENAVSGSAYRPGDIVQSRKGTTIEVNNTDAEGRVVLADALTEAVSEKPDLLIDIATLTGAARVALGTDLPALFSNNDKVANDIFAHGNQEQDYVWRLPLFSGYREALNSPIADINNSPLDGYAGAITAALFLKEFVPDTIPWVHFDIMAWNLKTRPGRPQGGEAQVLRALMSYLIKRYK